jgi:acyl carrier protein
MGSTLETVRSILADKLACPLSKVTPDASFYKDLGIDSLDYAELVMELEKEFDITIPSSEASRITTVSQVIDYINRRIKVCKGLSNY